MKHYIKHQKRWRKKLFDPVYHKIVEKMRTCIRNGELSGRLPGIRQLGKQFSVNPATITKALRILEEKGYVSIVPKLGAFVISKGNTVITHTLGVICIRQNGEFDESEQRYLRSLYHYSPYTVSQIAAEIDTEAEQQGFHAILIHIGAEQLRQNPAYLTTLPVDGMIFIFSSLTYEIAEILKKKHIPFISTNACYSISEVNYIDFNMVQGIGDLLSLLLAQGYTRIAYFAPAGKYGFKQRIYNMFRKKLGNLFHEEFFVTGSDSSGEESTLENDPERISACAEKLLCGTKDVPEVILCNADLADLLETMIRRYAPRLPHAIHVAQITIDPKQQTIGIIGNAKELFQKATRRLISVIQEDDDSVIQQWLPVRILWPENTNIRMETAASENEFSMSKKYQSLQ